MRNGLVTLPATCYFFNLTYFSSQNKVDIIDIILPS